MSSKLRTDNRRKWLRYSADAIAVFVALGIVLAITIYAFKPSGPPHFLRGAYIVICEYADTGNDGRFVGADGGLLYSWRSNCFIFFGGNNPPLLDKDHGWWAPENAPLRNMRFNEYHPSRHDKSLEKTPATKVFALAGPGTVFGEVPNAIDAESLDAASENTILLISVGGQNIHWMEPVDVWVTPKEGQLSIEKLLAENPEDVFHVVFVDGEIWELEHDTPAGAIRRLSNIETARTLDRDKELAPYLIEK